MRTRSGGSSVGTWDQMVDSDLAVASSSFVISKGTSLGQGTLSAASRTSSCSPIAEVVRTSTRGAARASQRRENMSEKSCSETWGDRAVIQRPASLRKATLSLRSSGRRLEGVSSSKAGCLLWDGWGGGGGYDEKPTGNQLGVINGFSDCWKT
jgi:hypothetical protein